MNRLILFVAVAGLPLGACATDPAYDHQIAGFATGAAIGAGVGALAGSVIPGIGTGAGAVVGGIAGGAIGVAVNEHHYHRSSHGYCYYVDQYGYAHPAYHVRC
jgi:hypothetical protein